MRFAEWTAGFCACLVAWQQVVSMKEAAEKGAGPGQETQKLKKAIASLRTELTRERAKREKAVAGAHDEITQLKDTISELGDELRRFRSEWKGSARPVLVVGNGDDRLARDEGTPPSDQANRIRESERLIREQVVQYHETIQALRGLIRR
jgi:hypothetical protein